MTYYLFFLYVECLGTFYTPNSGLKKSGIIVCTLAKVGCDILKMAILWWLAHSFLHGLYVWHYSNKTKTPTCPPPLLSSHGQSCRVRSASDGPECSRNEPPGLWRWWDLDYRRSLRYSAEHTPGPVQRQKRREENEANTENKALPSNNQFGWKHNTQLSRRKN